MTPDNKTSAQQEGKSGACFLLRVCRCTCKSQKSAQSAVCGLCQMKTDAFNLEVTLHNFLFT